MKKYLLLLVLAVNAHADVVSSGPNGFEINIERTALVDVQTAYLQFLQVADWWHADHTWFGTADGLYIEPRVGGCFCEKTGEQQALHMTVSHIDPGKEVRMVGGLGPLQMMGVHGGMSWRFVAVGEDQTKIIQHYQLTGYAKDSLAALAPIVDQVQTLQHERLVSLLNN